MGLAVGVVAYSGTSDVSYLWFMFDDALNVGAKFYRKKCSFMWFICSVEK